MTDELTTRLQRSMSEASLTPEVKAAHLAAISEALQGAPVVPLDSVSRRRRVIAAITAAALIGPTGLAAASDDALPGEALYGVKQMSEQVTSLFDPEVIARHRIEEAEALAMLGRRSDDAITRATDAVADLPEDHALRQRLAALADDRDDDDSDGTDPAPVVQPEQDDREDDGSADIDDSGEDTDEAVRDDDAASADDDIAPVDDTMDDGAVTDADTDTDDEVTDDAVQPDDDDPDDGDDPDDDPDDFDDDSVDD